MARDKESPPSNTTVPLSTLRPGECFFFPMAPWDYDARVGTLLYLSFGGARVKLDAQRVDPHQNGGSDVVKAEETIIAPATEVVRMGFARQTDLQRFLRELVKTQFAKLETLNERRAAVLARIAALQQSQKMVSRGEPRKGTRKSRQRTHSR